jgi:hypothetical protein
MTCQSNVRADAFGRQRFAEGSAGRSAISLLLSVASVFLIECTAATAQPNTGGDAGLEPNEQKRDAAVAQTGQQLEALPEKHRPRIDLTLKPETGLKTGDLVHLRITAEAAADDDITIPDNAFGAFEVHKKDVRIESLPEQRKRFIFTIDLIALEPGEQTLPEITLRVVTGDGIVGGVQTKARKLRIESLLANEPDAKPKGPTKPVEVMQDDYTLLYVLGGILAAALVALLTLVAARWWRKRTKPSPPPPPPRPPWEIAVEKLQQLQRDKAKMMQEERGGEFVDGVSDVVREYLGGRFAGGHLAFTGLETTSSELIAILRDLRVEVNLLQEITAFLFRCDLVKFAKVSPNRDEVDLIFAEAQEIVRISTPHETTKDATPDAFKSADADAGGRSAV